MEQSYLKVNFLKQFFENFVYLKKLFMFALHSITCNKMDHSAKNSALGTSHTMGCNDSMMFSMPMIMRQPSCGVLIHIV
jgi:hypothetical protein